MSDAEPLPDILSNAGRCDICGKTVDMEHSGDRLTIAEFRIEDEVLKAEHGLDDQDAIDAVADALERVAETPEGRDLARVIREEGAIRVHQSCLDETNYSMLETDFPQRSSADK